MSDPSNIRAGMPVLGSDGERVGTVDGVEGGDRIKLKRVDSPDGQHHHVPLSQVSRVDESVHLNQPAGALRSSWGATAAGVAGAGATTGGAATTQETHGARQVHVEEKDGANWLPWLLGALALLALLIFGLRSCDDERGTVQTTRTDTAQGAAQTTVVRDGDGEALARETVILPNQQEGAAGAARR